MKFLGQFAGEAGRRMRTSLVNCIFDVLTVICGKLPLPRGSSITVTGSFRAFGPAMAKMPRDIVTFAGFMLLSSGSRRES